MIAALYCRKSTDDSDRNAEARSTRRQIESATAYAERMGWTVDPRYIFVDENTSGAEWKHRPGFNALLLRHAGRSRLHHALSDRRAADSRPPRPAVRPPLPSATRERTHGDVRCYRGGGHSPPAYLRLILHYRRALHQGVRQRTADC